MKAMQRRADILYQFRGVDVSFLHLEQFLNPDLSLNSSQAAVRLLILRAACL